VNKNKALLLSLQLQLISQPQEVRRLSNSLPISSKRSIQPCPRGHQSVPGRYVNRTEPCQPHGCPAMQRAFVLTSSFYLTGHILYACSATDSLRLISPSISSESLAQRGMLARCYQFHSCPHWLFSCFPSCKSRRCPGPFSATKWSVNPLSSTLY
jgi:hypothetical protein